MWHLKRRVFLLFLSAETLIVAAQVPLTLPTNALRHGDVLCKIQMPYVAPGDAGEGEVWHLGTVSDDYPDFMQEINSNGDTIAVYEAERIQHYVVRGDTLLDKGEQSRRAHNIYNVERPMLRYPFQYRDSIAGGYSGTGRYELHTFTTEGFGYTVADGMGCLTDGEDTLRHVTRLHMHDDYLQTYDNGTVQQFSSERYLWYCAGYRYPVMETALTYLQQDGVVCAVDSVAYLYLPVMQLAQLAEDDENAQLLAELSEADELARRHTENGGEGGSVSLASINASLSPDGKTLLITYSLSDAASGLSFIACDMVGNLLGSAHYANRPAGEWQESINLTRRPIGGVLMLNVQCAGQEMRIKVSQ